MRGFEPGAARITRKLLPDPALSSKRCGPDRRQMRLQT
jgi:hypothetical protein